MIPPVKPGDSIARAFTAKVFNKLVQPAKHKPTPKQKRRQHIPVTIIGVGTEINQYQAVDITGPVLTNTDEGNLFNEYYRYPMCNISSSITEQGWGVAQAPINNNSPGEVVLSGLTWVYADVQSLGHKRIGVDGGVLVSGDKGKARIITLPTTTGPGYCLVMIETLPNTVQTVVTQIRVSPTTVQYKTRDLLVFVDDDETDWIDLPSVVCPEVPE